MSLLSSSLPSSSMVIAYNILFIIYSNIIISLVNYTQHARITFNFLTACHPTTPPTQCRRTIHLYYSVHHFFFFISHSAHPPATAEQFEHPKNSSRQSECVYEFVINKLNITRIVFLPFYPPHHFPSLINPLCI